MENHLGVGVRLKAVAERYLAAFQEACVDTLVLGCTHYPLIKKQVENYYKEQVEIIDSSEIVAASLKAYLEYNLLINTSGDSKNEFMVSDYTQSFEELTKLFFGEQVHLEKYKLWE